MNATRSVGQPLIAHPEQGRSYDMGRIRAVFYADGAETDNRYSVSEWWLEPRTRGPDPHSHVQDHIYRVLTGTLSLVVAGKRSEAGPGTYVLIPGGVEHFFENRGLEKCGFVSITTPGGFEEKMPSIVAWFADNPPRDVEGA